MPRVEAYIAIGSNLDNPRAHAARAVRDIGHLQYTRVTASSRWYLSAPLGPPGQPDYVNGVIRIETAQPPEILLASLQAIEDSHGRLRNERWGPRTLDLDILLYGNSCLATETLQIPHPRMAARNFVLYPLADIDPELVLPDGSALTELLANVSTAGIVPLSDGD